MQKIYNFCYVHIHNIHSCNIDFKMLISKLSGMNIKIIYTLHDVWPITGGCFYYNFIGCKKWINGCNGICPQNYKRCNKSWEEKKNLFNLLKNKITFISVSKWLNNELEFSFLKDFKRLINPGECSIVPLNSIDNELINKMNLKNKKILITVSSYWNDWKGYKYIYEVADRLPENYVILVIGGLFDTRNKKNIIHISQLKNECLNSYYSIADCFVSVTQDDNLPLVLMEAQICGVPIVGFGHGGTPEEIIEGKTGYMVGTDNNVDLLVKKIRYVCEKKPFTITDIKKNGEKYKQYEHAKRMLKIYNNL